MVNQHPVEGAGPERPPGAEGLSLYDEGFLCLPRERAGDDAVGEGERGTHGSDDGGFSVEADALAEAIHGFDARAMRAEQIRDTKLLQFVGRPIELLVRSGKQVKAAQNSINGTIVKLGSSVGQNIDDARMTAACNHNQALRRVQDERLIFRNVVFGQAFRRLDFSRFAPVALRELPRHRAGKPRAGKKLRPAFVLDEFAAGGFVLLANGHHLVVFTFGSGPAIKDSLANVDDGHGAGVFLHPFAAKREQAGHVVPMVVSEDDFPDPGEVDLQVARVDGHRFRMRPGVEENAMAVRFDEGGESPFAKPRRFSHEHRGEHSDFEGVDLGGRVAGRRRRGVSWGVS
jgi:hypothetical protein